LIDVRFLDSDACDCENNCLFACRLCSLGDLYERFGERCCIYLQGRRVNEVWKKSGLDIRNGIAGLGALSEQIVLRRRGKREQRDGENMALSDPWGQ
jgi:hypothetical protein